MNNNKISERRREARAHSAKGGKVVKIRTEGKGLGVLKTMFVGLLILLQLVLMALFYFGLTNSFRIYQVVALVLSIICCVHVLSTEKTGQTKTVWVLFLLLFSSFGYIAYFMSSEAIFFGWAKRRYKKIFDRTECFTPQYCGLSNICRPVEGDVEYLWNAGGFAPYRNTPLKYFSSGAQLFDDVLSRIKTAKKFVFIEFFIITDGVLLNRFYDALSKKAAEGVDVRIICDGMGSHGTLSYRSRKRLKKAGIKIHRFNRIVPMFTFALNLRDHRKIVVVDGHTAYAGGCNLADEYVNEKRMHGYWKDAGIRAQGAAVNAFTLTFLRQWEFITKKTEDYAPFLSEAQDGAADASEGYVTVPYADGKDYNLNVCKGVYSNIIAGACEKLYIMTPYFVPDEDTAALLAQKARSGVDVRIILPGVPDKAYVYRVSVDNAERLISSGVKIYKMRHAFVHSKIVLSENCVSVGSGNIDLRSYYNQFENGVYTNDKTVLNAVLNDFNCTFSGCLQVTEENSTRNTFLPRILAGVLRIFSPLM